MTPEEWLADALWRDQWDRTRPEGESMTTVDRLRGRERMSDERVKVIAERWAEVKPDPQCEEWWYSAVRHCQRNMDGLCAHDDWFGDRETDQPDVHPDRYEGPRYAHAAEDIHFLLSLVPISGERPKEET